LIQDALWLTALDFDGNIVWQKRLESYESEHGYGASPLIYKSLVIVVGDHAGGGILVALNRQSGDVVWQVPRAEESNFSSPIVGHVCGRDQLLIMGPHETNSYDPNTGENLWRCDGPTKIAAGTMPSGDELVYASAGYPKRNLLCIRADGSGDVTDTHVVWRDKVAAYVPSLLLDDGLLYMLIDNGRFRCYEADNGQVVWDEKLDGGFSSSPVLVGGHIYVVNEEGVMYVLKPGREFEVVAENDLNDGGFATPVICDGRIYLRTSHNLYCLGKPSGS
jgi:outer membrane protein assembly factor BamB